MTTTNQSEVARLLEQIEAEYIAGQRALYDPAVGTAQHTIITARMERMGVLHNKLGDIVEGPMKAMALIVQRLDAIPHTHK